MFENSAPVKIPLQRFTSTMAITTGAPAEEGSFVRIANAARVRTGCFNARSQLKAQA
jgi:hypothetical protein